MYPQNDPNQIIGQDQNTNTSAPANGAHMLNMILLHSGDDSQKYARNNINLIVLSIFNYSLPIYSEHTDQNFYIHQYPNHKKRIGNIYLNQTFKIDTICGKDS
ncbi:MAG: hypothetical protein KatS3mg083_019 [Candidatus Dojkabacteria bacterium]|nr:MAG: hypothetical protein KatS3mg084_0649 [Candidatus Dojkabacteria bacterium]GIW57074.1 MAG: hypothetical protein KatS3mg083_019 [Candidatus Dojkabacteria bacterium]